VSDLTPGAAYRAAVRLLCQPIPTRRLRQLERRLRRLALRQQLDWNADLAVHDAA
jgi:hypothetical protein